ncbi:putative redox protein [Tistlia consotensis]|uniref:Putative redox protein n=1 Tax=Tistlia consotensis USBA 355 TaxID=560819 RepID=A0A1Y6BE49_9PROT|nr:bifunctional alpha/beta hydrolase/OsmC family protein [Tistlia consotensis]SMF04847.1 putative redox protein [Tistlia consotensis USBA 355]SNR54849.1 putative redox protein [Tistlia consotensis]
MAIRSEKFTFPGEGGLELAARLDLPEGAPRATALFAHCFTCTKDIFAAARIAERLAERGIAVLRFDFTGLGHSQGEFANSSFSSNVADLLHAADHLKRRGLAPDLLVGHSLGGAAVLAAAGDIPEVKAVATIAAPAEPSHVEHHFTGSRAAIERDGEAEVLLAGRPFRIKKQFLDDIAEHRLAERIAGLKRPLLIFHAPRDETVGIDNATRIFLAAKHPKSFVSLDDADHLLTRRRDAEFVAEVLAAWAGRYLPATIRQPEPVDSVAGQPVGEPAGAVTAGGETPAEGTVVVTESGSGRLGQTIRAGRHRLAADEPVAVGGEDGGPSPYDLLLAALGACTSMTLRLYAERKGWPLERTSVTLTHDKIHAEDCADCETRSGLLDRIGRRLELTGELDEAQRAKLLEIADKCPVHRTLTSEIRIETELT